MEQEGDEGKLKLPFLLVTGSTYPGADYSSNLGFFWFCLWLRRSGGRVAAASLFASQGIISSAHFWGDHGFDLWFLLQLSRFFKVIFIVWDRIFAGRFIICLGARVLRCIEFFFLVAFKSVHIHSFSPKLSEVI